jgi:hypothetical protein
MVSIPTARPAIARPAVRLALKSLRNDVFQLTSKQHRNINSASLDSGANDEDDNRINHVELSAKSICNNTVDKRSEPSSCNELVLITISS